MPAALIAGTDFDDALERWLEAVDYLTVCTPGGKGDAAQKLFQDELANASVYVLGNWATYRVLALAAAPEGGSVGWYSSATWT